MDVSGIELPGPWTHRYVAANGARFHVCEAHLSSQGADAPLVLLLHGFPEFWWAWRHQLPILSAAGYRAVAMDLRGYGSSDKTPRGYDAMTLADDVAGVVRALGARNAVLVGHGWGGLVAWTVASQNSDCVRALAVAGSPHPLHLVRSPASWRSSRLWAHLLAMQVPWLPERRMARSDYVDRHLARWSAAGSPFPSDAEAATYRAAFALWPSSHCALEYHRWLFRSRVRADGRRFNRLLRRRVVVPVLYVSGAEDPAEAPAAAAASARQVDAAFDHEVIAGAGHFPHEEQPEAFNARLSGWLSERATTP